MAAANRLETSFKFLEALGFNAWQRNLKTGETRASVNFWLGLGYDAHSAPLTLEATRKLYHPDDANLAIDELEIQLRSDEPFEVEIRMRTANGEWRFIRFRGCVLEWDITGNPVIIGGTLTDLTDEVIAARTQRRATDLIATLSSRERQVLDYLLVGAANKNIAYEVGLSQRTVEAYRGRLMEKMGVKGVGELVQIALAGGATRAAAPLTDPRPRALQGETCGSAQDGR